MYQYQTDRPVIPWSSPFHFKNIDTLAFFRIVVRMSHIVGNKEFLFKVNLFFKKKESMELID